MQIGNVYTTKRHERPGAERHDRSILYSAGRHPFVVFSQPVKTEEDPMADAAQEIDARIRDYIIDSLGYTDPVKADQSLRESNVFDSTNLVEFVMYLEEEFDVEFDDDDMVAETFETINALVKFVQQKQDE